jgi:hypothetical protein
MTTEPQLALYDDLYVAPITPQQATQLVIQHHYLHRRPPISHAYGLHQTTNNQTNIVGVVTYGTPASRHAQISACNTQPANVIELNRLWVDDTMPRNTESWFVSRTLKQLPPHIVISYADTTHGHIGYIYRALGFHYAGWTDMDRKTPRFDRNPIKTGLHSREASRTGWEGITRRQPKVRYWTITGNRTQRRHLSQLATWPTLNWHQTPPPTETPT